ncbi:MFS transporter [Candidatus Schmidhempelia bombi]|uniref:MFS transporter n=1 Tax=Candidatus Schmidhempelia bombi str. Bimp TaxID=1387197 RepID=A0AB94ICK2_9GAMM|nr:MFS transporter [Candidatus Schmidhempelia bombi]TEA27145.1 MFS transporter [Candidatus Schmidhempelia bombi str. Bimp]
MNLTKRLSLLIYNNKLLLIVGISWLFNALDIGLFSFLLTAIKQDWGLSSNQLTYIVNINSVGMVIGACLFGLYADSRGRKPVLIFTLILFSIFSGLCAFAWNFTSFIILRFIMGIGLGGQLPVILTLISEQAPLAEKDKIISLIEVFWSFGIIFSTLIGYFLLSIAAISWQTVMLLMATPALYAFYLAYNLMDIPRYQKPNLLKNPKMVEFKLGYLFNSKYRKNTLMLWIVWFCIIFSYYGLFLWLPNIMIMKGIGFVQSFKYIILITIVQIPSYFSVIWLIRYVSGKLILIMYLIGTLISAELFGNADSMMELLSYGSLLSFFNLGAWAALYIHTTEQYPSFIRATGIGATVSIGLIGSILGPLMAKWLMANAVPIPSIFSVFSIAILIAVLTLVMQNECTQQEQME